MYRLLAVILRFVLLLAALFAVSRILDAIIGPMLGGAATVALLFGYGQFEYNRRRRQAEFDGRTIARGLRPEGPEEREIRLAEIADPQLRLRVAARLDEIGGVEVRDGTRIYRFPVWFRRVPNARYWRRALQATPFLALAALLPDTPGYIRIVLLVPGVLFLRSAWKWSRLDYAFEMAVELTDTAITWTRPDGRRYSMPRSVASVERAADGSLLVRSRDTGFEVRISTLLVGFNDLARRLLGTGISVSCDPDAVS